MLIAPCAPTARVGEDTRLTGLRADEHTRVFLVTLRQPCGWSFEETTGEFNASSEGRLLNNISAGRLEVCDDC